MTKKYRVKIDTPWAKKGEICDNSTRFYVTLDLGNGFFESCYKAIVDDPSRFPEIFEPIPDPVEKVAEWLARNANCVSDAVFVKSAKKLLEAGLDPERLG